MAWRGGRPGFTRTPAAGGGQERGVEPQDPDPTAVFDDENFDPIKYINQKFPDEQSLERIDDEIDFLKGELDTLNFEILTNIHDHALQNADIKKELLKSQETSHQYASSTFFLTKIPESSKRSSRSGPCPKNLKT